MPPFTGGISYVIRYAASNHCPGDVKHRLGAEPKRRQWRMKRGSKRPENEPVCSFSVKNGRQPWAGKRSEQQVMRAAAKQDADCELDRTSEVK